MTQGERITGKGLPGLSQMLPIADVFPKRLTDALGNGLFETENFAEIFSDPTREDRLVDSEGAALTMAWICATAIANNHWMEIKPEVLLMPEADDEEEFLDEAMQELLNLEYVEEYENDGEIWWQPTEKMVADVKQSLKNEDITGQIIAENMLLRAMNAQEPYDEQWDAN